MPRGGRSKISLLGPGISLYCCGLDEGCVPFFNVGIRLVVVGSWMTILGSGFGWDSGASRVMLVEDWAGGWFVDWFCAATVSAAVMDTRKITPNLFMDKVRAQAGGCQSVWNAVFGFAQKRFRGILG
jgi:hypothetical protein